MMTARAHRNRTIYCVSVFVISARGAHSCAKNRDVCAVVCVVLLSTRHHTIRDREHHVLCVSGFSHEFYGISMVDEPPAMTCTNAVFVYDTLNDNNNLLRDEERWV